MDQNGLPTIRTQIGDLDDATNAGVSNRLKNVETPEVSFAALIDGMLRETDEPLGILIDPTTRNIIAADVDNLHTQILAGNLKVQTITPEANQTGRSLTWSETARDTGFPAAVGDAAKALVDPQRPLRSVSSLAAAILNSIPTDTAAGNVPFVLVDQRSGTVKLITTDNRTGSESAIEAEPEQGTNAGVHVQIAEPADDGEATPLVFEGGSV